MCYTRLIYIFQCVLSKINIQNISGEDIDVVTPVPIPNTEVKHIGADDSWGTLPAKIGICQIFFMSKNMNLNRFFFLFCEKHTTSDIQGQPFLSHFRACHMTRASNARPYKSHSKIDIHHPTFRDNLSCRISVRVT